MSVIQDPIAMTQVVRNYNQTATSGIEAQFRMERSVIVVVVETNQVSGLILLTRSLANLMHISASHVKVEVIVL